MTTDREPPPRSVADIVATVLLGVVGLTAGVFLGGLYLVFTPLQPWWPAWALACIGMMVVPVVTLVVGIVRLVRRRRAFWVPLVGLLVVVVLFATVWSLGMSIQPVLAPSEAPLTN